jgi:hypothetical protein
VVIFCPPFGEQKGAARTVGDYDPFCKPGDFIVNQVPATINQLKTGCPMFFEITYSWKFMFFIRELAVLGTE